MGTNYYVIDKSDYCEHCKRGESEIHLGKSSMGWCFALHVYPEKNINNLDDIVEFINEKIIKNEYGVVVSLKEFLSVVQERVRSSNSSTDKPYGYESWEEFHRRNKSVFGPKGLLRSKIDGSHCIGHGDGTWDYMIGEFF